MDDESKERKNERREGQRKERVDRETSLFSSTKMSWKNGIAGKEGRMAAAERWAGVDNAALKGLLRSGELA